MTQAQTQRYDDTFDGLADAMKGETWDLHKQAEKTGIMADMFKGRASRESYVLFMRNLLPIYRTLEAATSALEAFPTMQYGFTPALYRAPALEQDLAALSSPAALKALPFLRSAQRYCKDIELSVEADPAALLGHIYVRYLGDLYGGQTLAKVLERTLHLPPEGLSFYDFRAAGELIDVRSRFRHSLNDLRVTSAQKDAAVAAALSAFQFNIDVSEEVSASIVQDV
ncbi:MAG: biliverdin-producing heme oxygenase [Pseudomonadota bacterium]